MAEDELEGITIDDQDDGIDTGAAGSAGGGDDGKTPEQVEKDRVAALERDNERLRAFRPILDEIDKDPSKIFDVRAALEGKSRGGGTDTTVTPPPQMTQEQRDELNRRATDLILEGKGLDVVLEVASRLNQERDAQMRPQFEAQAEIVVDRFLSKHEKALDPKLFRAIESEFEVEMKDLDRASLATMPADRRNAELERRFYAAAGKKLLSKVRSSAASRGGSGGAGGGAIGAGGGSARGGLTQKEKDVLARSGVPKKEIDEMDREMAEAGR